MTLRTNRSWSASCATLLIGVVVSTGCGGFTVLLGGGRTHGGYDYGGYSYHDSYWYYDDYDAESLDEPTRWDAKRGPWERFVTARVDFLVAERAQGSSEP